MSSQRLNKTLAQAGIASRRASEEIIFQGRVSVNGVVTRLPQALINLKKDIILVDGEKIKPQSHVYYLFNKPPGYLCSNVKDRRTIYRFFPNEEKRIFSIGRLDKDTSGLLLMTNDGNFAQKVIHPSSNISKEYIVKTNQDISHEHLIVIAKGGVIENTFIKPVKVQKIRKGTLRIVIKEGKKHEVRHLVSFANLPILELKRVRIGSLRLGSLPMGGSRTLTEKEMLSVFQ